MSGGKSVADLEDVLSVQKVLEPVPAEVADVDVLAKEGAGLLRQQHLATVSARRDPRGTVHVDAYVALVGEQRLSGVEPHAHLHRSARECTLSLGRCGDGTARRSECVEKRVALGIDLYAIVRSEYPAQAAAMIRKGVRVAIAKLTQQ